MKNLYRYRWVLEYVTGVRVVGKWGGPFQDEGRRACDHSRQGLARAAIERECRKTFTTKYVVDCKPADYVEHCWIGAAPVILAGSPIPPLIQGLALFTLDAKIYCTNDGNIFTQPVRERRPLYATT
jgi:hypothetical protein